MLIKILQKSGGRVVEETYMVALSASEEALLSFFLYFLSFLRKSTVHLEVIMAILYQALPAKCLQLYFI